MIDLHTLSLPLLPELADNLSGTSDNLVTPDVVTLCMCLTQGQCQQITLYKLNEQDDITNQLERIWMEVVMANFRY